MGARWAVLATDWGLDKSKKYEYGEDIEMCRKPIHADNIAPESPEREEQHDNIRNL